jgi:peroxiredoxin
VSGLRAGDPAPDATVEGEGGARLRLSELWSRGPLVLVFLRHFG